MKKVIVLAIALMASSFVHAANVRYVAPGGDTSFAISKKEVNRIAIKGDRITSFVKIEGSFASENDPKSGDLFITPIDDDTNGNMISGFITTEQGQTFQVFLALRDMPSTNTELQLKQFGKNPDKARKWERQFPNQKLTALNLARAMQNERSLPGFTSERYEKGIKFKAVSLGALTARIHGLTVGNHFFGEEIRVLNQTKSPQPLTERMLNDKYVIGVFIMGAAARSRTHDDTFDVAPGESIRIYRIKQNFIN